MPDINIMVDIETMGTGHYASIVAIGAVVFDPDTMELGERFYGTCTRESSVALGLKEDDATIKWWESQSDAARGEWKNATGTITELLEEFADWMKTTGPWRNRLVWGNCATFDNELIKDAFAVAEMKLPWAWYNDRSYRTLKGLPGAPPAEKFGEGEVAHNALDDAIHQAKHAMVIIDAMEFNELKLL